MQRQPTPHYQSHRTPLDQPAPQLQPHISQHGQIQHGHDAHYTPQSNGHLQNSLPPHQSSHHQHLPASQRNSNLGEYSNPVNFPPSPFYPAVPNDQISPQENQQFPHNHGSGTVAGPDFNTRPPFGDQHAQFGPPHQRFPPNPEFQRFPSHNSAQEGRFQCEYPFEPSDPQHPQHHQRNMGHQNNMQPFAQHDYDNLQQPYLREDFTSQGSFQQAGPMSIGPRTAPQNITSTNRSHQAMEPSNCESDNHDQQRNQDIVQRATDQEWLDKWLAKNKMYQRLKKRKPPQDTLSIPEARKLLRQSLQLTEKLQLIQEELQALLGDADTRWQDKYEEACQVKSRLEEIQQRIPPDVVDQLAKKLIKRKKARMQLKKKRSDGYRAKREAQDKTEELHRKIDEWQNQILQRDLDVKMEKEMKATADETLGEVRRKISEAQRVVDLLNSLTKLRQLRKEAAERKSLYTPKEVDHLFEERKERMLVMVKEQLSVYEAEKKTLETVLEIEAEENKEKELERKRQKKVELERRKERQICRILFGKETAVDEEDPRFPFYQFYNVAEQNLEALLQIRREWDTYLRRIGSGGSHIQYCWVEPYEPSSDVWASALRDRQQES